MLRKHSEVFRTLCAISDASIVGASWAAAYAVRFHTSLFPAPVSAPDPLSYTVFGLGILPLWYLLMRRAELYAPRRGFRRWEDETRRIVGASILGLLILAAGTFFWQATPISRLVLVLFGAGSTLGLSLFRAALRAGLAELRRRGFNGRTVLIVGTGALARAVHERFRGDQQTGLHVIGFLGPSVAGLGGNTPPNLGGFADLHRIVSTQAVDHVVIALDREDPADPIKLVRELHDTTAAIRFVPDMLGLQTLRMGIEDFSGLPMIRLVESPLVGWNQIRKRSFDLVATAGGLVLISPALALIALAIRLSSPGAPVLFKQVRMGLDGRPFRMFKFRTMIPNAEAATGPRWTQPNDPRRTPLGSVLRSLSIDELPQLWNVLRGEMSLVGPRPERPEFIREFRKEIPGYMMRHKMKAGMTGWAQINGCRGNSSVERRLQFDMDYAQRWSLGFDIKILLLTFVRVLRDPNAY